ncbi:MAG: sulfate/molybdate ABC transporter ATP-binding protein [Acidaminococcaceae bacterium]
MLDVDFTKKLGEFELKVKFAITSEKLAILGASGCGKSMTLKCIAGIETPDSGRIVLNDRVLYDSSKGINLPPQKRRVGYLFQNYALFPNMTVAQNIGFALEGKTDRNNIVKEFIGKLRLKGLENKYPAQISGGQQQRVALARMLALDTEMIMFDEPLSALDSFLKWELEQELLDIFSGLDRPILYVSHDRGEVFRLCDQIVILDKGEIVSNSSKQALFENPKTVTGAILTGCKNISPAFCRANGIAIADDWGVGFKIPQGIDDDNVRFVAVRAHLMMPGSEYENIFNAQIVNVIEDVFNWIVVLKLSPRAKKCFRWVVSKKELHRLQTGTNITVGIASEQVIFLES